MDTSTYTHCRSVDTVYAVFRSVSLSKTVPARPMGLVDLKLWSGDLVGHPFDTLKKWYGIALFYEHILSFGPLRPKGNIRGFGKLGSR